jgi:hypothetical protein
LKALAKRLLIQLFVLPLAVSVAFAQTDPQESEAHVYTSPELDQMLAPIALYPDALLSQILIAATYPLEIVQATRWSHAHSNLKGEQAVQAADDQNWDPSVKSLVAFPQILIMMDTKLEWTERLGDAFLAQQTQVMDTVQKLRERAYSSGNLQSGEQVRVERQGETIVIEPARPEVVYIPYYDPLVVYGPWWYPAYPPVYWGPWPGYYVSPGFVGFSWGLGIGVSANFFFGAWDWPHRSIRIVDARPFYYHRVDRRPLPPGNVWRHDPDHRRGVPYRSTFVREQYRRSVPTPERRLDYRGYVPRTPDSRPDNRIVPGGSVPPRTVPGARPPEEHRVAPPAGSVERMRPSTPIVRPVPNYPTKAGPIVRPAPEPRPHVFEGVGRGQDVRRNSERGHTSLQAQPPVINRAPVQQPPVNRAPVQKQPPGRPPGRMVPPSSDGSRAPEGRMSGEQRGTR